MKKYRLAIVLLIMAAMMSGCESEEAPVLIEPIAVNESYRPVERGDISVSLCKIGHAEGREYCHFLKTQTDIDRILVDIGDYVHEGDVLATIDTASLMQEKEMLAAELEYQNNLLTARTAVGEKEKKILEIDKRNAEKNVQSLVTDQSIRDEALKDEEIEVSGQEMDSLDYAVEKAKEYESDAKTAQLVGLENIDFDIMMANHRITVINEEIVKIDEKIEKCTVTAMHDGYVTYVKNLKNGSTVEGFENIVIVTDTDDIHLTLDEKVSSSLWNRMEDSYKQIYAQVGGKKYELKRHEYSNSEYAQMKGNEKYPPIMLEFTEECPLKSGDITAVMMVGAQSPQTLCVGTDSLYRSDSEAWVYVNVDGKKEKRVVTIGLETDEMAEVTSGLEEGELVYYSSMTMMPAKYDELKAARSDYSNDSSTIGIKAAKEYTKCISYTQNMKGRVKKVNVTKGATVEAGELLCEIAVDEGKSGIVESSNLKSEAEEKYLHDVEELRKQITDLERDKRHSYSDTEKREIDDRIAYIRANMDLLAVDYNYENRLADIESKFAADKSDADGIRCVYATESGVVGGLGVIDDMRIDTDDSVRLMQVSSADSLKLSVNTGNDVLTYGSIVTFTVGGASDSTFSGTVCGGSANPGRVYIGYYKDRPYITFSSDSNAQNNVVYIDSERDDIDKLTDITASYSKGTLHDVIVLPKKAVGEEVPRGSQLTRYYVWRVSGGKLVKTYVKTDASINSASEVCILSGIDEGDTIAIPQDEKRTDK